MPYRDDAGSVEVMRAAADEDVLEVTKENGTYSLEYRAHEDKTSFNEVVVTEETEADGLDGKPETHMLEGRF